MVTHLLAVLLLATAAYKERSEKLQGIFVVVNYLCNRNISMEDDISSNLVFIADLPKHT